MRVYSGVNTPLSSLLLLLYIRSHGSREKVVWVQEHWREAEHRFRWLFIGYLVVALLLGTIQVFVDSDSIAFVALTRVAVMPAVILVLITFVLSTAAIGRAGGGEGE